MAVELLRLQAHSRNSAQSMGSLTKDIVYLLLHQRFEQYLRKFEKFNQNMNFIRMQLILFTYSMAVNDVNFIVR